jgi:HD-like signal output (HDOD) protein
MLTSPADNTFHTPMNDVTDFLDNAEFLPPVPHVMVKVNEFLNDPNCSLEDFESVISQDQVISAKLLRLVNSSFYGFQNNIETVGQAISMVGYKQISDIAVGLSITNMFNESTPLNFDLEAFRQHSLACGVAARILSMYEGARDTEAYFTAGLLHDIGRMLLIFNDPEGYTKIMERNSSECKPAYILENEYYGFDHAELSGLLTRKWKFSERLQEAVRYHHHPGLAQGAVSFTATIHLANLMVHVCQIGASGDSLIPTFDREAWDLVGLNPAILKPVSERVQKQFNELEEEILK